jgi:hypothetical protein
LKVSFNQRACLTFLLFAFVAVILYLTLGLGPVARMVPLAVVIPTLLLLLFQLMMDMLPHLAQKYSRLESKDLFHVEGLRKKASKPIKDIEGDTLERNNERKVFFWLLAMLIVIYLLGLLLALPLYTLFYLKRRSENWLVAILVAVGIGCLVYAVSTLNLGTDLYKGLLWVWLKM